MQQGSQTHPSWATHTHTHAYTRRHPHTHTHIPSLYPLTIHIPAIPLFLTHRREMQQFYQTHPSWVTHTHTHAHTHANTLTHTLIIPAYNSHTNTPSLSNTQAHDAVVRSNTFLSGHTHTHTHTYTHRHPHTHPHIPSLYPLTIHIPTFPKKITHRREMQQGYQTRPSWDTRPRA